MWAVSVQVSFSDCQTRAALPESAQGFGRSSRRSWEDLKRKGHNRIYSFRKKIALVETQ